MNSGNWADLRSGRRIKLQLQVCGARRWILERPIFNRVVAGDRPFGMQISAGCQRRPNSLILGGGYSVYRLVFGSNPVDLFVCGGKAQDLLFVQDTSLIRGQFANRGRIRRLYIAVRLPTAVRFVFRSGYIAYTSLFVQFAKICFLVSSRNRGNCV